MIHLLSCFFHYVYYTLLGCCKICKHINGQGEIIQVKMVPKLECLCKPRSSFSAVADFRPISMSI